MRTSFTFTLDNISNMSPDQIADHLEDSAKLLRTFVYKGKPLKPFHSSAITLSNPYMCLGSWNIAYHED